MKQSKTILAILGFTLVSSLVFSQKEGDISQMYLSGKWSAVCPMEIVDRVTIQNCELCPIVINQNQAQTSDILITFMKDSLQLIRNGGSEMVPYKRDQNNHSIQFKYNNKDFSFRVFHYGDRRILVGKDGLIMVLEAV